MRFKCVHGYFFIDEFKSGDISKFASKFELEIVPKDWYYTFAFLEDAPNYSIAGGEYLGAAATVTFSGEPWDVMRENGLVYDFSAGLLKPLATVVQKADINTGANYYLSDGLIMPGSLTDGGLRVKDYTAWHLSGDRFKYTNIGAE